MKEPDLDPKQARIKDFLLRKHQPAATNNLNSKTQETVEVGGKENTQGATCGPLLGVTGFRSPQAPSGRSPDPQTEVRGRLWEEEGKKRTNKALEFWRTKQLSRKSDKEKAGLSTPQSGRKEATRKQLMIDRFITQGKMEKKYTENNEIGQKSKETSEEPEESPQEK